MTRRNNLVIVEPFCGGSHGSFTKWLQAYMGESMKVTLLSLRDSKWQWRLRAASMWAAQSIPKETPVQDTTLFVSSMLNLSELLALRPDLLPCWKVLYMHENQLAYPMQDHSSNSNKDNNERGNDAKKQVDFSLCWAQVTSCLAADVIAWNSIYNFESFLYELPLLVRMIPDKAQRPNITPILDILRAKSVVLYLPLLAPPLEMFLTANSTEVGNSAPIENSNSSTDRLCIAWNHRWEYDKCPEVFFDVLKRLDDAGCDFEVVLLGESSHDVMPVFAQAHEWLRAKGKVRHWGYAPSKEDYWRLLYRSDVVVSTAIHEFFGLAMLEGVAAGCYPLAPLDLSYAELLAPMEVEAGVSCLDAVQKRVQELVEGRIPSILDVAETKGNTSEIAAKSTTETAQAVPGALNPYNVKSNAGGQGGGRGSKFTPPSRSSVHLYKNANALFKSLRQLCSTPNLARVYKISRNDLETLVQRDKDSSPAGNSDESGTQSVVGVKRERAIFNSAAVEASGATQVPTKWPGWRFSERDLGPLYRRLLQQDSATVSS